MSVETETVLILLFDVRCKVKMKHTRDTWIESNRAPRAFASALAKRLIETSARLERLAPALGSLWRLLRSPGATRRPRVQTPVHTAQHSGLLPTLSSHPQLVSLEES